MMTHHEGGHGHAHGHGHEHQHEYPHPSGFRHHGECPYCGGAYKSKEDEISALEKYKEDISEQLKFLDKRIEELRSG